MLKIATHAVLCLALAAVSAAAQGSALSGPVSGLLIDEQSRSVRPIIGMPGSAYAGTPLVSSFDFASTAPDGRNALVAKDQTLYLVRRLDGGAPVWREFAKSESLPSRVAWSDGAESVALVNEDASALDLWSGLASEPKLTGTVSLTGITERIVAIAVDKDAAFAFASTQGESSGTLYLLTPGAEPRMLMPLTGAGALLLTGNSLYVADRGLSTVTRVTNWSQNPNLATVASSGSGVADPVGVALSQDGKLLYVANAESRQILAYDLKSNTLKGALDLDFVPKGLDRMGSSSLFLLRNGVAGEQPAQVLDTAAQKVFFVPVGLAVSGGE
ncbi:beta-propeller fold lactonase family protein [uncultured Paludibaculum sp.]|uniref:YncE family protein n=1 Tax=uncultured Paludibaculum sp. TaxID=1765020 RepID=UPI002AABCFC2|nr:beta-propeller fold lactonase family protein [uncultured Paludibaculum sp.]